jgi:hypothetical protein
MLLIFWTCSVIDQKLKNMKNTLKNSIILTCHVDFALISTDFVRWVCNFTLSTTLHMTFFVFHWLTSKNDFKKYFWCLDVKLSLFGGIFVLIYFEYKNCIFSKHIWRLLNKIRKNVMCILVPHVKLQPQWTKSAERRAKSVKSQNYKFFQCIFLIFQFLINYIAWSNYYQKSSLSYIWMLNIKTSLYRENKNHPKINQNYF